MNVKNNHFYRKQVATNAVGVKPQFKDLPPSTETMLTLKGGVDPTFYAISGSVPVAPKFGQYELDGGELQIYCSGVTMDKQPTLPLLDIYKFKNGTQINEGGVSIAHLSGNTANTEVGHKLNVYVGTMYADNFLVEESFDGTDKSLGEVQLFQNQTNSSVSLTDAFVSPKDGADKLFSGAGNYPVGGNEEENLKRYFATDNKVHVAPVKKNKPKGMWTSKVDNRPNKWSIYVPYWKYKDLVKILQFDSTNPSTNNPDTEPEPTENNTLLSNFYTTPNINNPYSSDANNPLILSSLSLSTEKARNGPQSLRFYHLFDWSPQVAAVNMRFGDRGYAPQVSRASLTPIPFPWVNNFGMTGRVGDNRAQVPQMDVSLNIAKLGPQVTINPKDPGNNGLAHPFSMYRQNHITSFNDFGSAHTTFARSVAITFSNYEPKKEHTTIDKFLEYGMNRFYTGESTENIVGGMVFVKPSNGVDTFTANVNTDYAYCFTIPTCKYGIISSSNFLNSGSMYMCVGSGTQTAGSVQTPANTGDAKIMIMDQMASFVSGTVANPPLSLSGSEIGMVAVPMDSFFTMNFCFDAFQYTSVATNSRNPYEIADKHVGDDCAAGPDYYLGSPIRCYFPDLPRDEDESDDPLTELPHIDIPFPAKGLNANGSSLSPWYPLASGSSATTFGNSLWPHVMTIWVNNHRYYSNYDGSAYGPLSTVDKPYFGQTGGYNTPSDSTLNASGTSMETEVFIDSIKLKYFNNDIDNASATKGTFSRDIMIDSKQAISPLRFNSNSGGVIYQNAWATGTNVGSVSSSGTLVDRTVGQPICLGLNEKAYLPLYVSGTTDARGRAGYIQLGGYNTKDFSSTTRILPSYTVGSGSSGAGTGEKALISKIGGTNTNLLGGTVLADAYVNTTSRSDDGNNAIQAQGLYTSLASGGKLGVNVSGGVYYASGANGYLSTDALTQKGFMRVVVSGSDFTDWTKRENILCAAKITGIPDYDPESTELIALGEEVISVDNPEIFGTDEDDEYMIFKVGSLLTDTSARSGYSSYTLKLAQSDSIQGTNVKLKRTVDSTGIPQSIQSADDGSKLLTKANLPMLYISPKKYWLTILNHSYQAGPRSYDSAVIVNEDLYIASGSLSTYTGTTYNESTYSYDVTQMASAGTSGIYTKPWDTEPSSPNTALVVDQDYGYGTYDEETQKGGALAQAPATKSQFVYFDVTKMVKMDDELSYGSEFLLKLGLVDDVDDRQATIIGDENTDTDYVPTFTWSYYDELPKANKFTVAPATNTVADKTNLYDLTKEDLNAVKFNWEEEAEDIWYRHLFINDTNIPHKYTNARLHIPLNESGSVTAAPSYKYGYYEAGFGQGNVDVSGSNVRATIEGLQGYAAQLASGSYLAIPNSRNSAMLNLQKYFLTVHAIPADGVTLNADGQVLVSKGTTGTGFKLWINGDGKVVVEQRGSSITGTSIVPFDGQTPLNVSVAYHYESYSGKDLKLYVNGVLEGYEDSVYFEQMNAQLRLGYGYDDKGAFTGKIEEFVLYNLSNSDNTPSGLKDIKVIDASDEYIYNTSQLEDLSGTDTATHQSKMFLMDYHNIRGESDAQVCSTNQAAWRASPL